MASVIVANVLVAGSGVEEINHDEDYKENHVM